MMNRSNLRKLILGGAIAALGVWYVLGQLLPGIGPAKAGAATVDAAAVCEVADESLALVVSTDAPELDQRRLLAAAPWPANPFFRAAAGEPEAHRQGRAAVSATEPRYALTATLSGEQPLAMINGEVLSIGDRLGDGSTITAINDWAVSLQGPHGPWILRLSE
jgi:hypothetical protein